MGKQRFSAATLPLLVLGWLTVSVTAGDSTLSAPVNVTIRELEANTAIVTWEILEGDPVIGFAVTQQKKDVRMLRYIQEVNTTTRSCALWDLEEDTEYIVHVQSISMGGSSPPSDPVSFRTPRESEKLASTGPDEVNREEMEQAVQLRVGELIIIVVVLVMWAGDCRKSFIKMKTVDADHLHPNTPVGGILWILLVSVRRATHTHPQSMEYTLLAFSQLHSPVGKNCKDFV
uniref:Fibronectin type III domain containing 5b n=1 Tax=Oncorhynchus mykiss TaxID=8022 RepID=A0A8K9WL43_ONCMY